MIKSRVMKKKFCLLMLMTLVALHSYAQSWNIQPKIGLNVATMTNDDDAKSRLAFVGGLEFEYFASSDFSFSFGALYSQQGCKGESDGFAGTIKLDYINVPLIANYYLADGFALKVGIQPGFLINDKVKVSANSVLVEVGLEESLKASGFDAKLKSLDLSIPIGLSYTINNIQLDARYNWGMTKIISGPGIDSTKNSVFEFTIGYKFGL